MESNSAYFLARAEEERAAAVVARTAEARRVHFELASRYEELAAVLRQSQLRRLEKTSLGGTASSISRAEVAPGLKTAFPLPRSGAFDDLLQALYDE